MSVPAAAIALMLATPAQAESTLLTTTPAEQAGGLAVGPAKSDPVIVDQQAASAQPAVSPVPAAPPAVPPVPPADPAAPPAVPAAPPASAPPPIVIVLPSFPAADAEGGEIVVAGRAEVPGDPLSALNAKSFDAIQSVDKAVVGPVAKGYRKGIPRPIRTGLRNFLRNLEEPVIFLNYLLQLKPGRALKSAGRFAVNSTIGIAGLVDVAKNKPFNLPYTPNGFANTFACYGIGPGPYFYLPLVGPTTLRDLIGVGMDRAALPALVGAPLDRPYYAIPANVIDSLNDRIEIDGQLNQIREPSADPYAATRDLYLKQRKAEIAAICPRKGAKPAEPLPPRPGKGAD